MIFEALVIRLALCTPLTRGTKLYMYFIPTHPKALLFTRQDGIGDFYEPFVAEIRATEIGIEARHRLSPRGFVLS